MKRVFISISLCLIVAVSFAQSKNVSNAQKLVKMENPDYAEARNLIKSALENPETSSDAKTWYVAGFIESQQFENLSNKLVMGMTLNADEEKAMYDAILAMLPYFQKTEELDYVPDAKGKIKPKFKGSIKSALSNAHHYYINGGSIAFDAKDYPKAYEYWNDYVIIPDMKAFEGDKSMEKLKNDTTYQMIAYYSGIAASQMKDSQKAIEAYEKVNKMGYKNEEVLQYLAFEYDQIGDKDNYIATLKQGAERFPDNDYFQLSIINAYITANEYDKAISALEEAIRQQPQKAVLYTVLGGIYENQGNIEKARENFIKAMELNPNDAEIQSNLGRTYFNEAVKKVADANNISDQAKYQATLAEGKELYKQAMPYFEKAHELKPDENEYKIALRSIYYNLNMGDKYDQMEKELAQ
ncbi:MAG: tetratricopeptide repeat protein [Bacteroidales bacterium]|nr:tetratricopeptide repeat protein [Bacteroidales bacterium]